MYAKKQKPDNRKKMIILVVCAVLVLGAAAFIIYRISTKQAAVTKDGQTVNLKPATDEEKQISDDSKQEIIDRDKVAEDNKATDPSVQKQAVVTLSDADAREARAYATGVFEEGGTCTFTATKGSQTYTKSSTGFKNASYTQCMPISWDTPLGTGTWSINVAYSSTTASGSTRRDIEVK